MGWWRRSFASYFRIILNNCKFSRKGKGGLSPFSNANPHFRIRGTYHSSNFRETFVFGKTPLQGQKKEVMRRLRSTHLFFEREEKSFALTEKKKEVVTVTHLWSNAYNAYCLFGRAWVVRLVPFNQIQIAISTLKGGVERTYGRKKNVPCQEDFLQWKKDI